MEIMSVDMDGKSTYTARGLVKSQLQPALNEYDNRKEIQLINTGGCERPGPQVKLQLNWFIAKSACCRSLFNSRSETAWSLIRISGIQRGAGLNLLAATEGF